MLLDAYRDYYNTRRHHTALGATPRHAWQAAPRPRRPGPPAPPGRRHRPRPHRRRQRLRQTRHPFKLSHIGKDRAGQAITAIRDHDRVTIYAPAGQPLGHIRLDHHKHYQGTITPAA